jgi:PAS domain S-box-containing protein
MTIKKSDLMGAYAQSIGVEAAKELITEKINAAALMDKESYTEEEIARICSELVKEGGLISIVSQTYLVQLERKRSEEQTLLLDNIETQIWYLTDLKTCGAVNKARADFLGLEKSNLEGRNIYDVLGREEAEAGITSNREVFEKKKQVHTEEWVKNGKGETCILAITKTPKLNASGEVEYVICAAEDITERKRAEDEIKTSLKMKEVLLREIHHRVRNNLQIMSSLLTMQARATNNKDTIDILTESRNRINAMTLIHNQLYESKDIPEINMKGFVEKLLRLMFQNYPVHETKINTIVHVADCPLPVSLAVPAGLIVNELLTNAFKYAFVNRKSGTIEVVLRVSEKGVVSLTVSDDGVGLPEGFDVNTTKTLGLHLVKILAEDQLQGNLEVVSNNGATFTAEFEMARGGKNYELGITN